MKGLNDLGTVFINKEGHRYCRGSNCEIAYSSVSEVIGKYKIPYNAEYWSVYKAYQKVLMNRIQAQIPHLSQSGLEKRSKEMMRNSLFEYTSNPNNKCVINSGENMEALLYAIKKDNVDIAELEAATMDILDLWKDKKDTSIVKGNMYHRVREITAINNGYELNAFDHKRYDLHLDKLAEAYVIEENAHRTLQEALVWSLDFSEEKRVITDDPYNDLPDGFYPELMISDDEYLVAGTADRIFFETIFGERFVDIDDYKTNIDIPKKSFFVRGQGYKMMQYPVENLMDCKHSYYNLQTSIYAYLLERKGFTVRNVGYHHLNTLNKCEYLRTEAMNVLEDFKEYKEKINNKNKI